MTTMTVPPPTPAANGERTRRPRFRAPGLGLILLLVAAFGPRPASAQLSSSIPLATRVTLDSEVLGGEQTIEIVVPEGYGETSARYPVLYVLDGMQNLRHVAGSAEVLARTGQIPPLIVVGIESTNRMRDFTPSAVSDVPYSGGAGAFLDFVEREAIPWVESHFRTHPFRVLEGHSLGGLFTAHAWMERPELMDAYIVMSPSFWWNGEEPARQAETFLRGNRDVDASIYFGIGSEDGQGMQNELARFVETVERQRGPGLRWKHRVFQGEGHMSAPLLINYYGLKFVFNEMRLPGELSESYDDRLFRAHERGIVAKYGDAAKQSGETYITLGLALMEEENYEGAITVLTRNAEAYPIFPPNYAWLAQAYEGNGQHAEALESYQEALRRSSAIHYGQEDAYRSEIERLQRAIDSGD